MIEEFKDVIVNIFNSEDKFINRDNIVVLMYQDLGEYVIGILTTTLPDYEYYKIVYNASKDEYVFSIYQKTKVGKATVKNEE